MNGTRYRRARDDCPRSLRPRLARSSPRKASTKKGLALPLRRLAPGHRQLGRPPCPTLVTLIVAADGVHHPPHHGHLSAQLWPIRASTSPLVAASGNTSSIPATMLS